MNLYGCHSCGRVVKPVKGKLTCCGITESVPKKKKKSKSSACTKCGGLYLGSAVGRFLDRECVCTVVSMEEWEDEDRNGAI